MADTDRKAKVRTTLSIMIRNVFTNMLLLDGLKAEVFLTFGK
jgi:hypothetical protein